MGRGEGGAEGFEREGGGERQINRERERETERQRERR